MIISEFHVEQVRRAAADRAVRHLGLHNSDLLTTPELEDQIRKAKPDLGRLLDRFRDAYRAWWSWHVAIEAQGLSGQLSDAQLKELVVLDQACSRARSALLSELGQV